MRHLPRDRPMRANIGSFPPKGTGQAQRGQKYGKPGPHFRLRILHALRMASFPTAVPRTHTGTAKSLSDAVLNPDCARTVHEWAVSESTGVSF